MSQLTIMDEYAIANKFYLGLSPIPGRRDLTEGEYEFIYYAAHTDGIRGLILPMKCLKAILDHLGETKEKHSYADFYMKYGHNIQIFPELTQIALEALD